MGLRPFGVYVHVPWCSSRCGYCDFNTYVPGAIDGASPRSFVDDALAEIRLIRERQGARHVAVSTVFFGGGTPTLLPAPDLADVLAGIDAEFGLVPGAEVTTEANPESVSPEYFGQLRAAGFTRVSLGMQSASPAVLATLDREHTSGRAVEAAQEAFDAGFEEVSLDLIYGTPGETDDDWRGSIEAALSADPTHVSAYSLIVEQGTKMARLVRSGELVPADDDVLARRYEMADQAFRSAGLDWYEVSNWARGGASGPSVCQHNLGYWHNDDWVGIGPGAHSHVADVRWWNQKHPARCSAALSRGELPIAGSEVLSSADQAVEAVMLGVRLAEGLSLDRVIPGHDGDLVDLITEGLIEPGLYSQGRVALTPQGRLLADLVVRRLT